MAAQIHVLRSAGAVGGGALQIWAVSRWGWGISHMAALISWERYSTVAPILVAEAGLGLLMGSRKRVGNISKKLYILPDC